jgi:hypothetical protein
MQEGRKFPQGENTFYDLPTINYERRGVLIGLISFQLDYSGEVLQALA